MALDGQSLFKDTREMDGLILSSLAQIILYIFIFQNGAFAY